jgi:molecular chaperone IbpA
MRTFDLSPLYRSTVGFDRLFSMLDGFEAAPGYPPYNIERTGENAYRITVAVAGFGENELSIESKENTLTIKGSKQTQTAPNGEVLYQGIAARAFERVFQLADYVTVKNAAPATPDLQNYRKRPGCPGALFYWLRLPFSIQAPLWRCHTPHHPESLWWLVRIAKYHDPIVGRTIAHQDRAVASAGPRGR